MRIKKDDYENLIGSLTVIYDAESNDERSLLYKISEYVKALLHYSYSVSLNKDEQGNEVRVVKESGTSIGTTLIDELKSIDETENVELEATYKKSLTEFEQITNKLDELVANDKAGKNITNQLEEIKDLISGKIPIRENKAILIHTKLIKLLEGILNERIDLSRIAKVSEDGQIESLNVTYFNKFLDRYNHWQLKNGANPWEAWQTLASISLVVDNDVDNKERLQKIGADNLVIEDNTKLSNEVNTILSGNILSKREQIPQEKEINRQFGLFHRFIIGKLQDGKAKLEVDAKLQIPSKILECGRLKVKKLEAEIAFDDIWYGGLQMGNNSIKMLLHLLEKPEQVSDYKAIITTIGAVCSKDEENLVAQQYKNQIVENLVSIGMPKNHALQIRSMIKSVPKVGYKISSK